MWPFTKKRKNIQIEWIDRAIEVASEKWIEFQELPFQETIPLAQRIFLFSEPLTAGLKTWVAFKDASDGAFLLVAAKGVQMSGTHTKREIEEALGRPLPD